VEDRTTGTAFDPTKKVGPRVLQACRKAGLITRGRGDSLYLGPPFTIDEAELDRLADIVIEAAKVI
jgi:adenosylmethionine-8-amino-7-oxononanoate aminotransferase